MLRQSLALTLSMGCAATASSDALPAHATANPAGSEAGATGLEGLPPGGLPPDACLEWIARKAPAFSPVSGGARGVETPLRLTGEVSGLRLRHAGGSTLHSVLDCRLAVALVLWAPALRSAGVREIVHFSIYRPDAMVRKSRRVSGHASGLAMDIGEFVLDDGRVLTVLEDWENRDKGQQVCPVPAGETEPTRTLRTLVCRAVEAGLFQIVITPHRQKYPGDHENHVHVEVVPEVHWTYVR